MDRRGLLAGHRNLDQYRQANDDALDGRVALDIPGIRLRENVYLGDGVQLPDLAQVEGPAYIGNFCEIDAGARIGPYSVLGNNVVVKDGATTQPRRDRLGRLHRPQRPRSRAPILGKRVDVRAHALINERRGRRRRVLDRRRGGARRRA